MQTNAEGLRKGLPRKTREELPKNYKNALRRRNYFECLINTQGFSCVYPPGRPLGVFGYSGKIGNRAQRIDPALAEFFCPIMGGSGGSPQGVERPAWGNRPFASRWVTAAVGNSVSSGPGRSAVTSPARRMGTGITRPVIARECSTGTDSGSMGEVLPGSEDGAGAGIALRGGGAGRHTHQILEPYGIATVENSAAIVTAIRFRQLRARCLRPRSVNWRSVRARYTPQR